MSLKPVDSTALDRVASRRNVIRAAAWTAPAVSIVVAAPAFAATSPVALTGPAVSISNVRNASSKTVTWTIDLTPSVAITAGALSVVFTGLTAVTDVVVQTGTTRWTGTGPSTRTYPLAITAGNTIRLVATFTRTDNSGGTSTATFTATSLTGAVAVSAAVK